MKKLVAAIVVAMICCGVGIAGEISIPAATSLALSSSQVSIPTGVFFNGTDFVKVESSWVRICINRESSEYDIRHTEMDPYGNYVVVLSNGECITIYKGGRSLYYDGTTYSKK